MQTPNNLGEPVIRLIDYKYLCISIEEYEQTLKELLVRKSVGEWTLIEHIVASLLHDANGRYLTLKLRNDSNPL